MNIELKSPIIIEAKTEQPLWKVAVGKVIEQGFSVEQRLDDTLKGVLMEFTGQVHDSKSRFHMMEVINAFCEYANSKGVAKIIGEPFKRQIVRYNRKSYTTDHSQIVISKHDYNVHNDIFSPACYLYDGETRGRRIETPHADRWCTPNSETVTACRHIIDNIIEDGYPWVERR